MNTSLGDKKERSNQRRVTAIVLCGEFGGLGVWADRQTGHVTTTINSQKA